MNVYPDPMLYALQDESTLLESLMQTARTVEVSLLYASNDMQAVFSRRLTEVRRQIALLMGEPS